MGIAELPSFAVDVGRGSAGASFPVIAESFGEMQMLMARQYRRLNSSSRCAVKRFASVLFAVLLCASAAHAADKEGHQATVTLKPANTSIRWTLSDPLHTVYGTFKLNKESLTSTSLMALLTV